MVKLISSAKRKEGFLLDGKNIVFEDGVNEDCDPETLTRLKSENKYFPLFLEEGVFSIIGLEEVKEVPTKKQKKKQYNNNSVDNNNV